MRNISKILSIMVCIVMIITSFKVIGVTSEIDTEPPEAVIHFNIDTREIVVYGIDNIDEDVEVVETIIKEKEHKTTICYTLTDDAGNILDLLVEYKSRDENREVRVLEMSYNNGKPIVLGENHFKVEFKTDKKTNELTHLHQNIHVIDKFKIDTNYKSEKEETSINYKGKGSCNTIFEVEGLALIDLRTDDGELIISRLTDVVADYYAIDELMDFYGYVDEYEDADVVRVDPLQLISYVSLVNASAVPMEIRFEDVFGVPEFLAGRWATDPTITTPGGKTINFVETYGDIFRLNSTTDSFTVSSVKMGRLNITNVKLQQTYHNVPVYGAEELVHLDQNGNVLFMHGTFVPEISVNTTPEITVTEAFEIAYEDLKGMFNDVRNVSILQYKLYVFNPAVGSELAADTNLLVWFLSIQTNNPYGNWYYFIDAQSGEIVEFQDAVRMAYHSSVWEDRGADEENILWYRDGRLIRMELPPTDASEANVYLRIYYDYLHDNFGYDSIDNAGMPLMALTYWGERIRNAQYYAPGHARFGEDFVTRDVVAHELTHGLVEESAGDLSLNNQPGALNEHFADSFAEFSDCHTRPNWLIGEDAEGDIVPGGALRNMANPRTEGDPDHIDDYSPGGSVHANAGIPNKVVYLITEGGIHNGVSVRGLGLHKAEQLVFSTLIDIGLTTSATFRQYHDVMLWTCKAMIGGAEGITLSDCKEVADAWRSVGISYLTQTVAGRTNEDFDMFGYSLATGDFNNDRKDDLAVGVPYENHLGRSNNGVVIVFYGSAIGLTASGAELLTQSLADTGENDHDKFGYSLAVGNFDGDDYDDLAVGVPYENIEEDDDTGQVVIFYGGSTGLIRDLVVIGAPSVECEVLDQEIAGYANEAYDKFGFSLAVGNFDGDGYDDLAVGAPFTDIGARDTGRVFVFYGRFNGLIKDVYFPGDLPVSCEVLDQEIAGEENERYDMFGYSLATGDINSDFYDDLAVGVPYEDIKRERAYNTGMVNVFYGDEEGLIVAGSATAELLDQSIVGEENENGDRFSFSLALGDFDGDSYYDLAIGTPGEDIVWGMLVFYNAGMVTVVYGADDGLIRDGIAKLPTRRERLDEEVYMPYLRSYFGYSLAIGKVDSDRYHDLIVGIPYADIYDPEDVESAGKVALFYGSRNGLIVGGSADFQNLYQEEMGGVSENGDMFGFAIAAGDFDNSLKDELAVSAPWENLPGGIRDSGVVYLWEG